MASLQSQHAGHQSDDLQELTLALRAELRSIHVFELFLSIVFSLLVGGAIAWLYWDRKQRVEVHRERQAAVGMLRELDAKTLKRILGEV